MSESLSKITSLLDLSLVLRDLPVDQTLAQQKTQQKAKSKSKVT